MSIPVSCSAYAVELRVEPDAAALLPQVEQVAAGVGDALDGLAQLRPAVAALAPEHVSGEALAVRADQRHGAASAAGRAAARSPSAKARCSRPSTSPSKLNTARVGRVPVGEPQRQRRPACGSSRLEGRSRHPLLSLLEPRREGVAQEHHVAELANVDERRPTARVPREGAVAHEPRSLGVADEHRRDGQLQLVDEVLGEELRVHRAAALDHQPLDAPRGEVGAERAHLHAVAAVDDRRDRPETRRARRPPSGSRSRRSSRRRRP